MKMRSAFLFIFFSSLSIALLVPFPLKAAPMTQEQKVLHLLNRLSFGPTPGEVEQVKKKGIEAYLRAQLNPRSITESPELLQQLKGFSTLMMSPVELFKTYGPPPEAELKDNPDKAAILKQKRQEAKIILDEAVKAKLLRALESKRQLQEVMTDFWYNHFNVFAGKGLDHLWVGSYEETAIRPYALGRFRDLLEATSHHPAMLFYLDNWQSTAPSSPGARGRFTGLNENYARELMELHTLGVDGGYTQKDVTELARIFTGWGLVSRRELRSGGEGLNLQGFFFDPRRHDFGEKVFFGHTFKAGAGVEEGERALDLLAKSPATARHISYQLAQYFVSDSPPPALVEALAQTFLRTNGNIRLVLNTLFHRPEFWKADTYGAKFKTPLHFVVSAVRATGVSTNNVAPLFEALRQAGMAPFACLTPDGYKNTQEAWLNPDGMLKRVSFATALSNGRNILPSGTPDMKGEEISKTVKPFLSPATQSAIAASPEALRAGMMLGSPEFMKF
jgi:uncharacterized protein (DUF1800 family)